MKLMVKELPYLLADDEQITLTFKNLSLGLQVIDLRKRYDIFFISLQVEYFILA